jgi:hypothetical protein
MPLPGRWRRLDRLPPPRGRDALPGVYELADAERQVLYIGHSASDVPNRVRQHLARPGCVRDQAVYWRYGPSRVPRAEEAALLAAYAQRFGRLPPCNRARPLPRDAIRRWRERSGGRG